jgi:hypothetical protein
MMKFSQQNTQISLTREVSITAKNLNQLPSTTYFNLTL